MYRPKGKPGLRPPLTLSISTGNNIVGPSTAVKGTVGVKTSTNATGATGVWRKKTTKKNKTWEGDGTIRRGPDGTIALTDDVGKFLARSGSTSSSTIEIGVIISIGSYEFEPEALSHEDAENEQADSLPSSIALLNQQQLARERAMDHPPPKRWKPNATPTTTTPTATAPTTVTPNLPKHDPKAKGAIIMPRPPLEPHREIVDVVIAPMLAQFLRPHQVEGVKFLYECFMGMRQFDGTGALLADEMGLGKTLMTITLIWTLLKQNPFVSNGTSSTNPGVIKRALIVCPATLVENWRKEFRKWLGRDRIGVFVVDSSTKKTSLADFVTGRVYRVMIIGYEKLVTVANDLAKIPFDLIVCDEGHRLKNPNSKANQAILSLPCQGKVILTGTPIQNDLHEFYVMAEFLNPGVLGKYSKFKQYYEVPILRSREPHASRADSKLGAERAQELNSITQQFILRRVSSDIKNFLPSKRDTVLFIRPTTDQRLEYRKLAESSSFLRECIDGEPGCVLEGISKLKKISNSSLLNKPTESGVSLLSSSGKFRFLAKFLAKLKSTTTEKVVIVSGYTSTLDLVEKLLNASGMRYGRLDGSVPNNKRQPLVDTFNNTSSSAQFAFLLSARAGGVGLNLIGASRLFLLDTDWNPSIDLQAMARIHRDGQRKPVFIYRLLTTGMIDEKIYQRQVTKQGLAGQLMEGEDTTSSSGGSDTFTREELLDLFTFYDATNCHTHDLLECTCLDPHSTPCDSQADSDNENEFGGWVSALSVHESGILQPKKSRDKMKMLFNYKHIDPKGSTDTGDQVLDSVLAETSVSFLFTQCMESDCVGERFVVESPVVGDRIAPRDNSLKGDRSSPGDSTLRGNNSLRGDRTSPRSVRISPRGAPPRVDDKTPKIEADSEEDELIASDDEL